MQTINSDENEKNKKTVSRMQNSRASVTASQASRRPILKVNNITFEEESVKKSTKGSRRGSMGIELR